MGLDMYLTRETYIKNWDHNGPDKQWTVTVERSDGFRLPLVCPREIVEEVGHWRKANQIHAWFVHNVQGDKDECQKAYVTKDDLEALFTACKAVHEDHSKAGALLPPQSGFFFGSTDFDEWYFSDIEETLKIVGGVLETTNWDLSDIYYRSSW
jgi:hypothetical protein